MASSGFHTLLAAEAAEGHSFDVILRKFGEDWGLRPRQSLERLSLSVILRRKYEATHGPRLLS